MKQTTITIIGIILILILLILFSYANYISDERNKKLCETLNGSLFVYTLDQNVFLCQLNDGRIIDLDSGVEIKFNNKNE